MKVPNLGAIALVAMLALGSRKVSAQTTLTFDVNTCSAPFDNVIVNGTYIESNFQLTSLAPYGYWCDSNGSYPGSPAFYTYANSAVETLSKVGGGTFALNSIDLATFLGPDVSGPGPAGSVLFTGDLFGGGTVQATGSWGAASGNPTFSTFSFGSEWTNLIDVRFAQGAGLQPPNLYQLDNIVLDGGPSEVVPEPATLTLFATGFVGLAALRRRRRKA